MGNSLSGKKRMIKVMKIDGTTLKLKPPARAADVLRDYPGYNLLESEEVKRLGHRARPLDSHAQLETGKLYFLVELPRAPDHQRGPRRVWSGELHVSAKERLESLMLARRAMSDLSSVGRSSKVEAEENMDGSIRLKMRLPKAEVEKLMQDSRNAIEAAEKIMNLCAVTDGGAPTTTTQLPVPAVGTGRNEKRARFAAAPVEIIA
ncbi:unnamed protein product [Musa acuminata subsp. burmannicoides]